jgi:predicted TIM-barrel fold metal-dependent hydrolase
VLPHAEPVIDVDAHVTEPASLWVDRLPEKWRDQAPHVRRGDDGKDRWYVGDGEVMLTVGHTATAGWPDPFPAAPPTFEETPAAARDPHARLALLDDLGIGAQVLYPNVGGFGNQAFLALDDAALRLACVQAYNDWITEWAAAAPERLLPVTAVPFWDVEATVAEVERGAGMGHRGILFTGEPQRFGLPLLGDRHWDPLWRVAAETANPISFHLGGGDFTGPFTPERMAVHGIGPTYVKATVQLFLDNGVQILDLLLSGVLARHPDTRFVSVESGVGFLPFVLEAADYAFDEAAVRRERPEFALLPSEYFARQVYGCWFFEETALQRLVDKIGAANILFETDYPHPICLYGNVRAKIDAALAGVAPALRHQLLWANAAALYRVDAPLDTDSS